MKSGPRDDLITIERNTGTSENAFGEPQEGWVSFVDAWAQVIYGAGSERRESAVEGAEQTATFRILADTDTLSITAKDRVSFNGIWDIHTAVPLDRDGVEITAVRRG